jgi:hypothetical protein
MECFAIVFSFPAGICAGLGYSLILDQIVSRFRRVAKVFVWTSCIVLTGLIIESALLAALGAVTCRGLLGPAFSGTHLIIFVLGTPALANVLVLPRKIPLLSHWYVAGVLCGFLFTYLVVMQYVVSEALYGINGIEGPFS